jgi:hypothetical protein
MNGTSRAYPVANTIASKVPDVPSRNVTVEPETFATVDFTTAIFPSATEVRKSLESVIPAARTLRHGIQSPYSTSSTPNHAGIHVVSSSSNVGCP